MFLEDYKGFFSLDWAIFPISYQDLLFTCCAYPRYFGAQIFLIFFVSLYPFFFPNFVNCTRLPIRSMTPQALTISTTYSPKMSLVSQPLIGKNYTFQSTVIRITLSAKNKLGFIDGSIIYPENGDPDLINSQMRNNSIVISWILNSISQEIAASLLYSNTTQEIWEDLKEQFKQTIGPKIFNYNQN